MILLLNRTRTPAFASAARQARALIEAGGLHGHTSLAHAVLEDHQPGALILDHPDQPRTALIFNDNGFLFAFGAPDADLTSAALTEVPNLPIDRQGMGIFATSPAWEELLAGLLPDRLRQKRLGFRWQPDAGHPPPNWRERIPPELALAPIDEPLAHSIVDGTGTQDYGIDPWFIRIAGGPAAYAALGLGLALVESATRQIASICGICALGNGEAELEVGTTFGYRGRGLATLVSAAFLEQAVAQGWQPAYTCDSENLPSIAVARKLGFVKIDEITGFVLSSI